MRVQSQGCCERCGSALGGRSRWVDRCRITLLVGATEQVRDHNRLIDEHDEDLTQWVADEGVRLERDIARHRNEAASRGQLDSGYRWTGVAHLKEGALHRYRDQERNAQRRVRAIHDAEGWRHALLRTFKGPLPRLDTPTQVGPILDAWREAVHGDDRDFPVSDPTRRSLEWALEKYGRPGVYDQFS